MIDNNKDLSYNDAPTKNLEYIYNKAVADGWISSLAGSDNYLLQYNRIQKEIVGRKTVEGTLITESSDHFMERFLGTGIDPKKLVEENKIICRSGVEVDDIKEALLNGIARPPVTNPKTGQRSQLYSGKKCKMSVDPDTGVLIQCNPLRSV